jgi:hypothetical protein
MRRVESPVTNDTGQIHDQVVRAAVTSYEHIGDKAIPFWALNGQGLGVDDPDVLIPELRRVEEVATALSEISEIRLKRFRELGLEIWVLVPLTEIGAAHGRLRGLVDRIQAWWVEDNAIRFGEPRRP